MPEYLAAARAQIAQCPAEGFSLSFEAFRALDETAGADRPLFTRALELLDSFAPHPDTFLTWLDGARDVVVSGDWVGTEYRYDRKKNEILALIGKAAQQAWLAEKGEAA